MADETTQGVHPFTLAWWERLPAVYRRADRVQGYRVSDAWHGLNKDPRFITGWDKWVRANTSTEAWRASVSFTRTFRAIPNAPLHIRTWHRPVSINTNGDAIPDESGVTVRHTVRSQAGTVLADNQAPRVEGYGDGYIEHYTQVTPDRFGIVHITVHVSVEVPDARDFMDAVHIGHQDVTFAELPGLDYFTTASAYPLLRYMDGIGHQAGYLSDYVNDMHSGVFADPVTTPTHNLLFLAAILGVPRRYANRLTAGQLRAHLVDLVEGDYPIPGSRDHIAVTAQQWLTGTKDVSVAPAHTELSFVTTTEQALADAMGYTGRVRAVRVKEEPPHLVDHKWEGDEHASRSLRVIGLKTIAENQVLNPSFEVGTTYWSGHTGAVARDTTVAYTGAASLKFTPSTSNSYVATDLRAPTKPGPHVAQLAVRSAAAVSVRMVVSQEHPNVMQGPEDIGATVLLPAGEWVNLSLPFEALPDYTYSVAVQMVGATDPIWVDAVYVAHNDLASTNYFDGSRSPRVSTENYWIGTPHGSRSYRLVHGQTFYENLTLNPAFGTNLTYWSAVSATQTRDTTVFETGVASARINPTAAGWSWREDLKATPGIGEHVARFRVRSTTARDVRPRVWQDGGGTDTTGATVTLAAGVWTWIELPFTVTNPGHRYRAGLESTTGDASTTALWVDRVYTARSDRAVTLYFDGDSPDSTINDIWVKSSAPTGAYIWGGDGWTPYTATNVSAQVQAVLDDHADGDKERQCTLIIYAKATEVPDNDLDAFVAFLNDSGVIPAAHRIIARESYPSWDQWEEASGKTWNDQAQVINTWNDSDSAGVQNS